jgi:hypothetical protein
MPEAGSLRGFGKTPIILSGEAYIGKPTGASGDVDNCTASNSHEMRDGFRRNAGPVFPSRFTARAPLALARSKRGGAGNQPIPAVRVDFAARAGGVRGIVVL